MKCLLHICLHAADDFAMLIASCPCTELRVHVEEIFLIQRILSNCICQQANLCQMVPRENVLRFLENAANYRKSMKSFLCVARWATRPATENLNLTQLDNADGRSNRPLIWGNHTCWKSILKSLNVSGDPMVGMRRELKLAEVLIEMLVII